MELGLTEKQKIRKEGILRATEEWVYQHGFYKMSLDQLVGSLNISKSTIYEHFGSKDGLIERVVERFSERLEEGIEEIMNDTGLSTADKLAAIGHKQATAVFGLTNKFMDDLKFHTPHLMDKYEQSRKSRFEKYYYPLIQQGIKEGLFDSTYSADFLVQLYMKMSDLVAKTDILEKSGLNRTEGYDQVIKIFLNGTKEK